MFLGHNTLVLQVSGLFDMETATDRIMMRRGQMLLIRKNQLGQITKTPLPDEDYQTIVICLQEDLLPEEKLTTALGILKVKEAVQLLLHVQPALREFLFDFSEPHKIDLEKFMLSNFHFNVPVEKFAQLTGRSLAGFKRDFQKTFAMSPRQWLQEKRLTEARHLIERKNKKPSAIYLDLGFESLSHFSHAFKKKFGKAPNSL